MSAKIEQDPLFPVYTDLVDAIQRSDEQKVHSLLFGKWGDTFEFAHF
jgi:hypothetical protein